jgi:hypothetical protein
MLFTTQKDAKSYWGRLEREREREQLQETKKEIKKIRLKLGLRSFLGLESIGQTVLIGLSSPSVRPFLLL